MRKVRGAGDQSIGTYHPPDKLANQTLVAYAVSPGETALDRSPRNDRHGLYTHYLLQYLPEPGLDLIDALREIAMAVHGATVRVK